MSQANAAFDGDYPATAADPPAITAAATASLDSNGGGGGGGVARQEGELLSIGWAGFSELIGAAADILVYFVFVLAPFDTKNTEALPRQARDKHRKRCLKPEDVCFCLFLLLQVGCIPQRPGRRLTSTRLSSVRACLVLPCLVLSCLA